MDIGRNILVIGVGSGEFARVAPFLDRESFDVDRFPRARGALELLSGVAFEMLIVRYPLPDMETAEFLDTVRSPSFPSSRSPILLLTEDGSAVEAETYIGRGANRIVRLEESEGRIQTLVSELLSVAPRQAARFLARLEVKLGGAKDMILCETENLSSSGMLVRTDRHYDFGTKVDFEFSLPDDSRPIVGIAEIVRESSEDREGLRGIGVRFLSFAGDSQRRFEAFLQGPSR